MKPDSTTRCRVIHYKNEISRRARYRYRLPENVDNHQFTYVHYLLSSKKILTEVHFIDRVSEALKDLSVAMSDLALYF